MEHWRRRIHRQRLIHRKHYPNVLDYRQQPPHPIRDQGLRRNHAAPPASTREVPADWALKPADIGAGGQFRLMFVSSTSQDATSTNITDYNRFVRSRAGSAAEISSYARHFNALVSTELVNARENTFTRVADTEAPIYWVRSGAVDADSRVVDDYAKLYAGTWSTGTAGYSESGSSVALDSNRFWTGTEVGGETDSSGFLGAANVRYWVFDPAIDSGTATSSSPYRIAGLSPVFQVANSVPGKPTGLTATATAGNRRSISPGPPRPTTAVPPSSVTGSRSPATEPTGPTSSTTPKTLTPPTHTLDSAPASSATTASPPSMGLAHPRPPKAPTPLPAAPGGATCWSPIPANPTSLVSV